MKSTEQSNTQKTKSKERATQELEDISTVTNGYIGDLVTIHPNILSTLLIALGKNQEKTVLIPLIKLNLLNSEEGPDKPQSFSTVVTLDNLIFLIANLLSDIKSNADDLQTTSENSNPVDKICIKKSLEYLNEALESASQIKNILTNLK